MLHIMRHSSVEIQRDPAGMRKKPRSGNISLSLNQKMTGDTRDLLTIVAVTLTMENLSNRFIRFGNDWLD